MCIRDRVQAAVAAAAEPVVEAATTESEPAVEVAEPVQAVVEEAPETAEPVQAAAAAEEKEEVAE